MKLIAPNLGGPNRVGRPVDRKEAGAQLTCSASVFDFTEANAPVAFSMPVRDCPKGAQLLLLASNRS